MRQVGWVAQQLALMARVLVEHIDRLAEQSVGRDRQVLFDALQGLEAGLVGVVDAEVLEVAGHHVDRHLVDHFQEPFGVLLGLHLLGDDVPRQHRVQVGAAAAEDRPDVEVKHLAGDVDARRVRQVFRVAEQIALMLRPLVEDVDRGSDDILCLQVQGMLDRLEQLDRLGVGVVDGEVLQLTGHDRQRPIVDHLLEAVVDALGVPGEFLDHWYSLHVSRLRRRSASLSHLMVRAL